MIRKKGFFAIFPFLRRKGTANPISAPASEELFLARNEVQSLRMTLQEREQRIWTLEDDILRLQSRQAQMIQDERHASLQALLGEMAAPASQINTQLDLADRQGKTLQAQDVLLVARRFLRALERQGMVLEGTIGAQTAFDPNRHTPLGQTLPPTEGALVTIRFAGVSYQGAILYKALVEYLP